MISIGDRLDAKYLVAGRLGSGGFGEVFLAEDEAIPGRYVALKVLSGTAAADEDNLIWEMVALSQFNHPGVVAFHHHFSHQNRRVLVMEYCVGGSLADRRRRRWRHGRKRGRPMGGGAVRHVGGSA